MEFMKIGDKSLKITLNAKESKMYGLDENTEIDVDDMKGAFTKLLARARREVGYKFSGERVVAEIFNAKNGGCEIFLTYAEDEAKEKKPRYNGTKGRNMVSIFSISELNSIVNVAISLNSIGYDGKSSAYYDRERDRYYLILDEIPTKEPKYLFIGEFAKSIRPNSMGYIKEHCKCICKKDAIKVLSKI